MKLGELGEFGFIERVQQTLAQRAGVQLGIGDDAAILAPLTAPVVTCDALIEGVHFRLDWTTMHDLGHKALTVNVSDIAAMGGTPVAAFITLALPKSIEWPALAEFYQGLEACAAAHHLTVAGGDTTRSPGPLAISLTVIGNAPQAVRRSGAQVGDILIVTGSLGDAAAGLWLLQKPLQAPSAPLLARHHRPTARVAAMQAALTVRDGDGAFAVRAALDLSDGLAGDAAHIARASGATLEIEVAALPISPACRAAAQQARLSAEHWALHGGEDYELLLCVAPHLANQVQEAIRASGTAATIVGRVSTPQAAPVLLCETIGGQKTKREPAQGGFAHF